MLCCALTRFRRKVADRTSSSVTGILKEVARHTTTIPKLRSSTDKPLAGKTKPDAGIERAASSVLVLLQFGFLFAFDFK